MGAGSSNKPEAGGASAGLSGRQLPGTPPGHAEGTPGPFRRKVSHLRVQQERFGLIRSLPPRNPKLLRHGWVYESEASLQPPPDPEFPQVSRTDPLGRVHSSRVRVNRMKEPGKLPETALPAAGGPSAVPRQRVLQRLSPRGFSPLGWGTAWSKFPTGRLRGARGSREIWAPALALLLTG